MIDEPSASRRAARIPTAFHVLLCLCACSACGQQAAIPVADVPPVISSRVPAARIKTSSVLGQFNADGILRAAEPGWHADSPPVYPQWIEISFDEMQNIHGLALLPQDGNSRRAPREIRIAMSSDGGEWTLLTAIADACNRTGDTWRSHPLPLPVATMHLRLTILSNCGDRRFLTLRGLRVE